MPINLESLILAGIVLSDVALSVESVDESKLHKMVNPGTRGKLKEITRYGGRFTMGRLKRHFSIAVMIE